MPIDAAGSSLAAQGSIGLGYWTSRGGELLMQNSVVPTGDLAISFGQDARFVPEAGQTIDSATQAAIENLAERIVSQMEMRW